MTKKDYIKLAEMFASEKPSKPNGGFTEDVQIDRYEWALLTWKRIVNKTADLLASDNYRFNYDKFFDACGNTD